jgi:hypothetical protein
MVYKYGDHTVPYEKYKCPECKDRGYTFILPKYGMMTVCTKCEKGKEMEQKLDVLQTNLRSCRKMSRDGVLFRIEVK